MNFYFQAAQKTIDKKNQCDIFNAMKELNARQKKDGMDMTTGEPFKLLVIYSFPILLGSLFQQLYNMCDTIIVGRLLGPNALAAVGNTGPMNFLVLGFLNGMTSGLHPPLTYPVIFSYSKTSYHIAKSCSDRSNQIKTTVIYLFCLCFR